MKRIQELDTAKGIGILLVILGHSLILGGGEHVLSSIIQYSIFSFHMPLFVVVTGLTLNVENRDIKYFIKHKAKTILLPYYLFWTPYLLFEILVENQRYDLRDIITSLLAFRTAFTSGYWFFPALFISELIVWVVHKLFLNKWERTLSCIIFLMINMLLKKYNIILPFCIEESLVFCSFIEIGMLLSKRIKLLLTLESEKRKLVFWKIIPAFTLSIVVVLLNRLYYSIYDSTIPDIFILLVTGTLGTILVLLFCSFIGNCKIINYIGLNSLLFYGVHYFPLRLFNFEINFSVGNYWLTIAVKIILIICSSLLAIFIINGIKINRCTKKY